MIVKDWTPQEILEFRKKYKLTRKVLGQLVGVTVTAVYQWEKEVRTPQRTTKILLSKVEEELKKKGGDKDGKTKRNL
ncbi:MAG TPA: hypothetical protein DDX84_04185 [Nitrospiraceae bacterium]|nr:hypothetical protein [Nitrospiraceae bacterium]